MPKILKNNKKQQKNHSKLKKLSGFSIKLKFFKIYRLNLLL